MRLDTMATPCSRLRSRGGWAEDLMGDRCSFPIGPWNTWSNVAYLLAGCYIWGWDRSLAGIVMAAGTLKIEDAAAVLGISEATAKRWWAYARAWLFHEISAQRR